MALGPRILQVVLSLNPGGTERLVVELVSRLNGEMPMMICCLDEPGDWAGEVQALGIEVHGLRRARGFRPALAEAIARTARRHGASVIHAHQYSPFVYSCLARIRHRARLVFTEHGRLSDAGPSPKRRLANRLLRRIPSRTFSVSSELADYLGNEGFRRDQIEVIYNGINAGPADDPEARKRRRAELGVPADVFVVGTVARLDPVKDLGALLRATALVAQERSVLLAIVGDGPERPILESEVASLGIAHLVRFLGKRDDARDWLWGCDAYANTSISEGVSLTILEAMAAGLPIVATAVGGTPEVLDDTCGHLVPARDPGAVAGALLNLARNEGLRSELGRRARQQLEARFTIERMVSAYRDVYLELA